MNADQLELEESSVYMFDLLRRCPLIVMVNILRSSRDVNHVSGA
ncbi:MAG: hypothetical protein LZF62_300003 [Nitrospira sp.]|nr:MAG: hypothetical protein LZF62_300003 [Nitrospira sp.]